jgi:uncharacterized repeat protein (TIGR03847 family)
VNSIVHAFQDPERFVAGTVGRPGERAFFLQVRDASRLVSVAVEKEQVRLLAERMDAMLDELLRSGRASTIPATAPTALLDDDPLDTPFDSDFRALSLAIGWDDDEQRVLVEAGSRPSDDEDDDEDEDGIAGAEDDQTLQVRITAGAARAFARRASALVAAGRPACPFCSLPLDPEGHVCPRANGYRR